MFAKPDSVITSSRSTMRNKEAKTLKQTIGSLFLARLTDIDKLLGTSGSSLDLIKFADKKTGYSLQGDSSLLFIDLDSKGHNLKLIPTLHALWLCPNLLPVVLIPPEVSPFIVGGADLMLPGCFTPLPSFKKGDLLAIRVCGNPCAIAIGEALLSSTEAQGTAGMKGRCLRSLLHFGDSLWDISGRIRPNDGFQGNSIIPIEIETTPGFTMPESALAMLMKKTNLGETSISSLVTTATTTLSTVSEESPAWQIPLEEADSTCLLQLTLFQILRNSRHLKKSELPMLASVFFGSVMQNARPRNRELDLKKSVFKKASAFFKAMEEEGILKLSEASSSKKGIPGELLIASVNKEHEMVLQHRPWPSSEEAGGIQKKEEEENMSKESSHAPSLTSVAGSGGDKFIAPIVTQFLMPQRLHIVIINTVNAILVSQKKTISGLIQLKGRRGGPITQKKLNTKLVLASTIVTDSTIYSKEEKLEELAVSQTPTLSDLLQVIPSPEKLLLKKNEAIELLNTYIKVRGLSDGKFIFIDDILKAYLSGKVLSEATIDILQKDTQSKTQTHLEGGGDDDDDEEEEENIVEKNTTTIASTFTGKRSSTIVDKIPCLLFDPNNLSTLELNTSSKGKSGIVYERIDREELVKVWISKFEHWFSISITIPQPNGQFAEETVVKKGEPPTIEITKKKGQANRSSTHIVGADKFSLDLHELAKALQKALACSATVQPNKENPTLMEVMLSGDETKRAREWILKETELNTAFVKVM
jgi:predicted ribosome-associated RNA-binding protein Tma20/translation initiation factor 1 (eIF-1/SUI1)